MARQKAAFGVLLGSQEPVGTAMLLPTQLLGRTVEKKKKKKDFTGSRDGESKLQDLQAPVSSAETLKQNLHQFC